MMISGQKGKKFFFNQITSIVGRLSIGLSITILLVTTSVLFFDYRHTKRKGLEKLNRRADEYVELASNALQLALWNLSPEEITVSAKSYADNELIKKLIIYNTNNEIVYSYMSPGNSQQMIYRSKGIRYNDEFVGRVELYVTSRILEEDLESLMGFSILIFVLSILSILIVTRILVLRYLDKPLKALNNITRSYGNGIYDIDNDIEVPQEFIPFIEVLSKMGKRIKTQLEQLKKSEKNYRGIVNNAVQGLFRMTEDGFIINGNPALAKILGFESLEVLKNKKTSFFDICFADDSRRIRFLERLEKEDYIEGFQTRGVKPDGTEFRVIISIRPAIDESTQRNIIEGSILDVTAHYEKEKAQREKEAALAATEAKSEFLAHMSHEIRTPMNAIIGLTDLTLRTDLTIKQRDYLHKVMNAANALLAIINDILDYSKIEAGKLDIEKVDFRLEDVITNLSNIISIQAETKGIRFLIDIPKEIPAYFVGDPLRMGQILINLCNNAVKFTEEGEVVVTARLLKEETKGECSIVTLQFEVRDTGLGISGEQQKILFQPFNQADASTSRKFGGSGLGLSISKKLIEQMGGKIWLHSETGSGSKFYFTIKLGVKKTVNDADVIGQKELNGLKVLIVDDNPTSREIISQVCQSFNFIVDQAASAEEALREFDGKKNKEKYDLVIVDWRMPRMDGIEFTKQLKEKYCQNHIPIILLMTAYGEEEIKSSALKAGVDAVMIKPIDPQLLLKTLSECFRKERQTLGYHPQMMQTNSGERNQLKSISGAKILLVEDNQLNQQVASGILEQEGFEVMTAENGAVAINKLESNNFDLILMDVQMPVMDGYEATERIKRDSRFNTIPIIAMTAHAIVSEKAKCFKAGMDDFLSKPIDQKELFNALVKWIKPIYKDKKNEFKVTRELKDDDTTFSIEEINIKDAIQRTGLSLSFFKRLLIGFHDDYKNVMVDLYRYYDNGNFPKISTISHTLKGISSNIGAEKLYDVTSEIENAVAQNQSNKVLKLLNQLDLAVNELMDSIEIKLEVNMVDEESADQTDNAHSFHISKEETIIIKNLIKALEDGSDQAMTIFSKWKQDQLNHIKNDSLNEIKKLILDYEFDSALERLQDLIEKR